MKKAYLFWYKSSEFARTEYIYIVAVSIKQARYFYIKNGYARMYDYSLNPLDDLPVEPIDYEIGTILGQYAIL